MLSPVFQKNDKVANAVIITLSVVVFLVVAMLGRYKLLNINLGFDPHIFAFISACINSLVSVLLILGIYFVKQKDYVKHKNVMLTAIVFSTLFLVSYICHHLFTIDTKFLGQGLIRWIYYPMLILHIVLAATILPFILFTSYRALTGEWAKHKKIAKFTFPIWLYVSISGVLIYILISPYYA